MKGNLKHKLRIFKIWKMKRLQIQQKPFYKQFYVHDKILRTRNSRRKFIKNLLLEKQKENM